MHHKRKRHPAARAGCALCKPQKKGKANPDTEVHHKGFGKIRALYKAKEEEECYIKRSS
jgi:hypothetical protein